MPQTDTRTREKIEALLGPDPKDLGHDILAQTYLKKRGYVLGSNYSWSAPKPQRPPTDEELLCVKYLIEEWDFGGLRNDN